MVCKPNEGDLYGVMSVGGKIFEIRYGYYEEMDRHGKYNDPIPLYPDFSENPEYSEAGYPIVTSMQNACEDFRGKSDEALCGCCSHFAGEADLFGICHCPKRKKRTSRQPMCTTDN